MHFTRHSSDGTSACHPAERLNLGLSAKRKVQRNRYIRPWQIWPAYSVQRTPNPENRLTLRGAVGVSNRESGDRIKGCSETARPGLRGPTVSFCTVSNFTVQVEHRLQRATFGRSTPHKAGRTA
jgi:hypothetical protein